MLSLAAIFLSPLYQVSEAATRKTHLCLLMFISSSGDYSLRPYRQLVYHTYSTLNSPTDHPSIGKGRIRRNLILLPIWLPKRLLSEPAMPGARQGVMCANLTFSHGWGLWCFTQLFPFVISNLGNIPSRLQANIASTSATIPATTNQANNVPDLAAGTTAIFLTKRTVRI